MKKLLLLPFIVMMGCGSSTPKCEESTTVETVKEIIIENDYQLKDIIKEKTDTTNYSAYNAETRNELYDSKREEIEGYIKMYNNGDFESVPNNVLNIINEYYASFALSNIRTNSIDETSKSCHCTAQFEKNDYKKEINYTAQRNSEGEIYVEVER